MRNASLIYSRYFTYIKPFTKIPIVKNYGPTIFTLFMITIFIFFAIKSTVTTILVLQKKLADSNLVLEKVTQKVNNLSLGQKNYNSLSQNITQKISAAIPDTVSLQSLIQNLEQNAKAEEASVSALQIQPLTVTTKTDEQNSTKHEELGKLSEISFTFNIEGNFANLIAVLQDLKTSSRLISVESLSLSKVSEGTGLIMSLSGKAYYIK